MRNRSDGPEPLDSDEQVLLEEKARRQEVDDLRWMMSDKRGRRVMWRLLETTGVYRSSFTGNSETFFREGQRNVGLKLLADIHENCPDAFVTMLKEHK